MANESFNNFGISANPSAVVATPVAPQAAVNPNAIQSTSTTLSGVVVTGKQNHHTDTRVRLRAMRGQEEQVYGTNSKSDSNYIMSILNETDGLLFPYTPQISVSQSVDYKTMELIHTNGDIASYSHTPSVGLEVSADFTVQNQREGRYALAVLHFLRTVSKMYFGEIDKKAGNAGMPPPVLVFNGYGNFVFNNLPVILKSHAYTFDKNMNMVTIKTDTTGLINLPTMFTITMSLMVQQTPQAMRKTFSLDAFRSGQLLSNSKSGTGWI